MSIAPERDLPHSPAGADTGFQDCVTFAFGDTGAKLYGLARIGLGGERASAMAVLYSGSAVAAAASESAIAVQEGDPPSWESVRAAGVSCTVEAPLEAWTVSFESDGGGFDLRFDARSTPAALAAESPAAQAGGMEGYEQLCALSGTVRVGDRTHSVRCLGQRGRLWGRPDWKRVELARTLSAWMGSDRAVMLTSVRPARARGHDAEAVSAWAVDGGETVEIYDARLSTTYDGELRQRRAGLELWMHEEGGFARRAAGEVLCGTTIELGDLRLESAFFDWRMEGRRGTGRYDVLRRVQAGRTR